MSTTGVMEYSDADIAQFAKELGGQPVLKLSAEVLQLIAYLNPKNANNNQAPGTVFKINSLQDKQVAVLELFLRKTDKEVLNLKSDVDLEVDDILRLLRAIAGNPVIKKIDIDLSCGYIVNDLITLQNFLALSEEQQRGVNAPNDEQELEDLTNAFNGFFTNALAGVNGFKDGAMQTGKTFLNTYVQPAVDFLKEEFLAEPEVVSEHENAHRRRNSAGF